MPEDASHVFILGENEPGHQRTVVLRSPMAHWSCFFPLASSIRYTSTSCDYHARPLSENSCVAFAPLCRLRLEQWSRGDPSNGVQSLQRLFVCAERFPERRALKYLQMLHDRGPIPYSRPERRQPRSFRVRIQLLQSVRSPRLAISLGITSH